MFKKKKVGTVQVFEDDEHISPRNSRGGDDDFDDLLGGGRRGGTTEADMEQMTASELEDLALAEARAGKDSTKRTLALAHETREVGVATAATMKAQTEQLERMRGNIEEVHDCLDKSDRVIDSMSKPKIVRMFGRKKAKGKGLDKVKAGKKELSEREKLRERGLDNVDLDGMAGGGSDDGDREELLSVTGVDKKGRRKKGATDNSSRAVQEDYSQYSQGVANVMREQDDDLDQISDALGDLNKLALGMNAELDLQSGLIDEVTGAVETTSTRTRAQAERVKRIK